MVYNKIYAQIGEERHITLDPVNYQYDVKQILVIQGETVPEYYEADVCNVGDTATLTMVGTAADGVEIPDRFFRDGRNVLVYVVIPGSGGDVQTRYDITIPVDERAEREDIDPSEAEQKQIDSLVAALNSGVGRAEAAAEAIQDMDVEAETLAAGSAASVEKTVDPETGAVTLNFGIPAGAQGNPGTPGQDGTTPDFRIGTVETLDPGQSATATITGTPAQPVLNLGIPQGQKGDPGGGSGTRDYTDLTNKPQINGHTLSGNQSAADLGLGTYSKPASGIPKTDLASDVQASLGKADSALQSAPVTSVAGKTGAVTLGAGDVGYDSTETYQSGTAGAALNDLNRQISDTDNYIGMLNSASRTINNTASYIGTSDSKLLFSAESGDEISINITGTAFTQSTYTAYVFYDDSPDTSVSVGNGTVGVDKTVTLTKNIVGVSIYALNLTEGTIVVACQNTLETGLTKRISDLEQATTNLDVDIDNLTENLENTDEKVDAFITVVKSKNLYKGTPLNGYWTGLTITDSTTYGHTPVMLLKTGSYLFTSAEQAMGDYAKRAIICDQNGNAQSYIVGTLVGNKTQAGVYNNRPILQFALQNDSYVSFNVGAIAGSGTAIYSGNFMVVEGTTINDFPDYEAYFDPYAKINEIVPLTGEMTAQVNGLSGLIGKTAIFDGDSICKGTINGTTPKETNGWARLIGAANEMEWHNYAVSGGVITSASNPSVSDKHSVVDNIDTMYAAYPDADFVIFEGGTNDADILGNAIQDPTILGTLSKTDYTGPFVTTTFTGALETIFSKAIGYWKGKAIGYIVAQKMGYGSGYYDKTHDNRRAYFERAIEVCQKWGIPYINLWDGCYMNPSNPDCYDQSKTKDQNIEGGYLYTDGQHLTEKGYAYISPMIEAWMKTL